MRRGAGQPTRDHRHVLLDAGGDLGRDALVHLADLVAPHDAAAVLRSSGLLDGGVNDAQAMQTGAELRREPLVGCGLVGEERVAACGRAVEQVEECCAWGLLLVGDV